MSRSILVLAGLSSVVIATAIVGCLSEGGTAPASAVNDSGTTNPVPVVDAQSVNEAGQLVDDPTKNPAIADSTENITYRDNLAEHPGCTTADLATRVNPDTTPSGYSAALIPGYPCAAREMKPAGVEDTNKALIILVHGNSSTPKDFLNNPEDTPEPGGVVTKVGNRLVEDGYHVFYVDFRFDKVPNETANAAKNMDHGWTVPILESLIRSLHAAYPTRKINLSGFSLGTTVIRDALRRMHHKGEAPFSYVHALHLVSGANHGVKNYGLLCGDPANPANKTMSGLCVCQMGNRENYAPTPFMSVLNGPNGAYETPCADGSTAYGQRDVCGGNRVLYTTAVHRDLPDGTLEDEFVSQRSSRLEGALDNRAITADDTSKYFFNGAFPHHYGAIRSAEGVDFAITALEQ